MSDASITIKDNGPPLVSGSVALTDGDGNLYAIEQPIIALCRCGQSENKPFCDGGHSRAGFDSVCRVDGWARGAARA